MKAKSLTLLAGALVLVQAAAMGQKTIDRAAGSQATDQPAQAQPATQTGTVAPAGEGRNRGGRNAASTAPQAMTAQVEPALAASGEVRFDANVSLPPAVVAKAKPVVEKAGKGSINWTKQYIEVTGTGIINNERFKIPAQARVAAQRAAVVDAQRNLLEIAKGVEVNSETTVKDLMLESDVVTTRINGIVKGAEQVGKPVEKDGAVTVTMRMPLYDNGVAEAVYEAVPAAQPVPAAEVAAVPVVNQGGAQMSNAASAPAGANSLAGSDAKQLAFNVLNGKINPQLFPVVYDDKGNVVLDTKKIFDPSKGQFPQILQAGKQIANAAGFTKATEIIDLVQSADGKLVLANTNRNATWKKIGNIAGKIGKFLLMLI